MALQGAGARTEALDLFSVLLPELRQRVTAQLATASPSVACAATSPLTAGAVAAGITGTKNVVEAKAVEAEPPSAVAVAVALGESGEGGSVADATLVAPFSVYALGAALNLLMEAVTRCALLPSRLGKMIISAVLCTLGVFTCLNTLQCNRGTPTLHWYSLLQEYTR